MRAALILGPILVVAGCRVEVRVDASEAARHGGARALERTRSLARSVEEIASGVGNIGRYLAVKRRARELGLGPYTTTEWIDWWTPQRNVIIEVPAALTTTALPSEAPLVFVFGHYDKIDLRPDAIVSRMALDILEPLLSWSYTSSGAVDNATGCAAVLELARTVALEPRPETYRFILFGSEESGLRGSRCYVAGLEQTDVARTILAVNLDSVGMRDAPNGVLSAPGDTRISEAAVATAKALGYELESWSLIPGLATSDHEPFFFSHWAIDIFRGALIFNLPGGFLPQRSWFTGFKHMPIIAFATPECFDWTDIVGGLLTLPIGTIHGPRDRGGMVDAWRLYEQYEIVRAFTESYPRRGTGAR